MPSSTASDPPAARRLLGRLVERRRAASIRHTLIAIVAVTATTVAILAPLTIPSADGGAAVAAPERSLIDSSSSKITYAGTWRTTRSPADHGGSVRFQSTAGSASMSFRGTSPLPAPIRTPTPLTAPRPSFGAHRYADCPTATTTVHTADELRSAIDRAGPGTVVRMAPGTYLGQIDVHANGTAAKPIWVCGPRDAVINVGGIQDNHGVQIKNSSNLVIAGMTVTNSLKGISVIGSSNVTIADTRINHIGYEGIHLRAFTTDSTVVGNTISNTGARDASYGEGIYIGTSENNWCAQTNCAPDHTDRILVLDNRITLTGAQPIEAKEGTSDGVIRGNVIDGANAMSDALEWIKVKGNDWTIDDNQGANSPLHGFAVNGSVAGWGLRNTFTHNTGAVNAGGYAFFIHEKGSRGSSHTDVSCSNSVTRAADGFSNLACTPRSSGFIPQALTRPRDFFRARDL